MTIGLAVLGAVPAVAAADVDVALLEPDDEHAAAPVATRATASTREVAFRIPPPPKVRRLPPHFDTLTACASRRAAKPRTVGSSSPRDGPHRRGLTWGTARIRRAAVRLDCRRTRTASGAPPGASGGRRTRQPNGAADCATPPAI